MRGFFVPRMSVLAFHRSEELVVGLGILHLAEQEFHRGQFVHWMQQLAQDPDLLQEVQFDQQFLAARAGAVDVDRGVDAFFGDAAIQVHFHVAGALEFLVNHLVHLQAGVDQRGGDDGQQAAVLGLARGAEEALGRLCRALASTPPISTHLARRGYDDVVGACEAGDGYLGRLGIYAPLGSL